MRIAELTNASTTGLLDVHRRGWDRELMTTLDIAPSLFPELGSPGDVLGPLRVDVRTETGLSSETLVTLVGSHDTASAVVAVPAAERPFAYIACGTWSLVGLELDAPGPDRGEPGRELHERGRRGRPGPLPAQRDGPVAAPGVAPDLGAGREPRAAAGPAASRRGELPAGGPTIDPDDPVFLPPGDMPARIAAACAADGQAPPASRPALVRCIVDSLAAAYARTIDDAARLAGRSIEVVHLVGGGARNALLCQLTADACGLPVVAGPVEATALGNVLVQARAHGLLAGDLERLRSLVRATQDVRTYEPRGSAARSGS